MVHTAEYDKDVRIIPRDKDQGQEWIANGYGMKKEKANAHMRLYRGNGDEQAWCG